MKLNSQNRNVIMDQADDLGLIRCLGPLKDYHEPLLGVRISSIQKREQK